MAKPPEMDKGESEILDTFTLIVKETEQQESSEQTDSRLEVLVFSVKEGINSIISSFTIAPLTFATVRGEVSEHEGYGGTTPNGTFISLLNSATGNRIITLSWDNTPPNRVILKQNGKLVDSQPVENNNVEFSVHNSGKYYIKTLTDKKIKSQFSIVLLDK